MLFLDIFDACVKSATSTRVHEIVQASLQSERDAVVLRPFCRQNFFKRSRNDQIGNIVSRCRSVRQWFYETKHVDFPFDTFDMITYLSKSLSTKALVSLTLTGRINMTSLCEVLTNPEKQLPNLETVTLNLLQKVCDYNDASRLLLKDNMASNFLSKWKYVRTLHLDMTFYRKERGCESDDSEIIMIDDDNSNGLHNWKGFTHTLSRMSNLCEVRFAFEHADDDKAATPFEVSNAARGTLLDLVEAVPLQVNVTQFVFSAFVPYSSKSPLEKWFLEDLSVTVSQRFPQLCTHSFICSFYGFSDLCKKWLVIQESSKSYGHQEIERNLQYLKRLRCESDLCSCDAGGC